MTKQRVTARILVLTAFRDLEREHGRRAFTLAEVADRVPENARSTISAHLSSFMADGRSHGEGYGGFERVEHGRYQLTPQGRGSQRKLGISS